MTPVTDVKIGFGSVLRYWRQQSGLSREKLAELADLHRTYVAGVESGTRNPSLLSVHKLAQVPGHLPGNLLFGRSPGFAAASAPAHAAGCLS